MNELVPCRQEGQRVTWRFSEKATKIEVSSLDVEHINGTSCSDFMKVAFPLLKVYKVGKNSLKCKNKVRMACQKNTNKVGMMHESKGQRVGKAPSLHLCHTAVRQWMGVF